MRSHAENARESALPTLWPSLIYIVLMHLWVLTSRGVSGGTLKINQISISVLSSTPHTKKMK